MLIADERRIKSYVLYLVYHFYVCPIHMCISVYYTSPHF